MLGRIEAALRSGRRELWLVAALGAAIMLPGLGAHDLWNPDEPRYGQVCREMRASGSWLVPRLNDEIYTQKPPLMFWAICAGAALRGGLDETAVRWPSAFAGIGVLMLVFSLGRDLFGRRAAWLATLVAATCVTVLWQSHVGQIDMLLTLLVLSAVYSWARGYLAGGSRRWWPFWLLTGLATLAKGPAGLLPPLLAIVVFLALERDREGLRGLRAGRGLLLWAAVVLAWLGPAVIAGGNEYFQEIVFKQNVTRYASPWHHFKPWYYFLTTIPVDFFPWSLFLPAAVASWLTLPAGAGRRNARFLVTWVAVTLVFFSVSPAKRGVYILATFPVMALLVGAAAERISRVSREGPGALSRAWLVVPAVLLGILLPALNVGVARFAAGRPEAAPLGDDLPALLAVTFLPASLGGIVAAALALLYRTRASLVSIACGIALTSTIAFVFLLPRFDAVKSARPLASTLEASAGRDDAVGIHPRLDPAFLFYSERFMIPLATREKIDEFISRPGRVWLLAERDDLARLSGPLPLVEVARDNDLLEGYVLFTSPPWPETGEGGER